MDKNEKNMGVVIIARDYEGKVMALMCTTKPYISDSAIAAWKMMEFSRDLIFQNIMMGGDALEIVLAL